MDEFLELEKKCKKLKAKKLIIYIGLVLILTILIIGLYLFFKPSKPKKIEKTIPKKIEKKVNQKIKKTPKEINKTIKIIKPKIKKVEPIKPQPKEHKEIKIIKKPTKIPQWKVEFNLDEINLTTPKPIIKKPITQQSQKVFKTQTISFDKALKLAKFYYNNEEYQDSMKWCKIASNIDNTNEEIWKLYALNLEKLNQKQKAIEVLKTYLKYKDSIELKLILKRLEK